MTSSSLWLQTALFLNDQHMPALQKKQKLLRQQHACKLPPSAFHTLKVTSPSSLYWHPRAQTLFPPPCLPSSCRLCELNVLRQVFHVATSPVVASAWSEGQELHLYGIIYDVADGHLKRLAGPISSDDGKLSTERVHGYTCMQWCVWVALESAVLPVSKT